MAKWFSTGLLVTAVTVLVPGLARANEEVYQKVLPGTAWISVNIGNGKASFGSGVLVDAQRCWVLTNHHVVRDKNDALVIFPVRDSGGVVAEKSYYTANVAQLAIPGKVIARKQECDLAVIELTRLPPGAQAVPLASLSARSGQVVHSIGNPMTEPALWLYSHGKVRQVYKKLVNVSAQDGFKSLINCRLVVSTLPINPGDSGGPVVNDNGELVALVSNNLTNHNALSFLIDVTEIRGMLSAAGGMGAPPPPGPGDFPKSSGPIHPAGTASPTAAAQAPPAGYPLVGTWKAKMTEPGITEPGKELDVTLMVTGDTLLITLQDPGGSVTISDTYVYSNNQLALGPKDLPTFVSITWINANEFIWRSPTATFHFRKVR